MLPYLQGEVAIQTVGENELRGRRIYPCLLRRRAKGMDMAVASTSRATAVVDGNILSMPCITNGMAQWLAANSGSSGGKIMVARKNTDATRLVTECAHCHLANTTRHKLSGILQGMSEMSPLL